KRTLFNQLTRNFDRQVSAKRISNQTNGTIRGMRQKLASYERSHFLEGCKSLQPPVVSNLHSIRRTSECSRQLYVGADRPKDVRHTIKWCALFPLSKTDHLHSVSKIVFRLEQKRVRRDDSL